MEKFGKATYAVIIGVIMGPYLKDDLNDDASTDDNETTKTF